MRFRWQNGLLAISNSMVDANGASKQPASGDEIELELDNVTADCTGGLLRMRLSSSASFGIPVVRNARRCLFDIRDSAPQFEFLGLGDLGEPSNWLLIRGEDNGYRIDPGQADPVLRMETEDGARKTYRFDVMARRDVDWIDEPDWVIQPEWATGRRPIGPPTSRRVSDYRLAEGQPEVGFSEDSLPTLTAIEVSSRPPAGTSDLPTGEF